MSPSPTATAAAVDGVWSILVSRETAEQLVTWTLVVLGWIVVSWDQNRRERRKEVRGSVLECIREIRIIEAKAHKYRLKTAAMDGKPLELQIKTRLKSLGKSLKRLRVHDGVDATDALTVFRQSVTGGDFESNARQPCSPDHVVVHEISDASVGLIEALEDAFRVRYASLRERLRR